MASLSSKTIKSSSCSSLQAPESTETTNEQKKIKKGKNKKKIRSTLGLNNFLDLTDDHPVAQAAKKTKTTKRGECLDFLPSLEGSSQSSRTCTSESDTQDAETSGRNLRPKNSRKATRNLTKSQIMLSVSEESAVELDKENAERARQSKRMTKRKLLKQKAVETEDSAEDIPEPKSIRQKVHEDAGEEKGLIKKAVDSPVPKVTKLSSTPALFKKSIIDNLIKTPAFENSPKRSIVDSPVRKVRVAAKISTPTLMKVNEDQGIEVPQVVDNLRKKSLLKRNRSTASPMPKIGDDVKLSSTLCLEKVNEEEVLNVLDDIEAMKNKAVVNSLRKNSKFTNSPIVDSPMPRQRLTAKLSSTPALKNLNEDIPKLPNAEVVKINGKHIIEAMKNTAVDNLRKNSVLRNSPKPKRSVSVVNSPKPNTSAVAKLSNTPAPKNLRKQSHFTPLKSANKASKRSTTSKIKSPEVSEQIKNTTFEIRGTVLPLDDEGIPNFDDDFSFDFIEIGDKKPTRRTKSSKTSSKSDISVIEISDSTTSSPEKYSLSDEVFEPSKKLKTETAMSDEIFYDSICHLASTTKSKLGAFENTTGSDEVFYDSMSQPASTKKSEISPRKLRSTFDKKESNQENLNTTFDKSEIDSIHQPSSNKKAKRGTFDKSDNNDAVVLQSPKKKQRTTFDKSEINHPDEKTKRGTFDKKSFVDEDPNPSPKKKLRSTFDKNEITQPGTSLLSDDPVFNFEVTGPTPIKNPKRSTFEKSPTKVPPNKTHLDSSKKNGKSSFAGSFSQHQSEDILDHLNITRRESRKTSFKRRASSFKYSTGSEDEATRRTKFVTLRRCNATAVLNQSTPLFGAKTQTAFKEFRKLEKSDNKTVNAKSPVPLKSMKKSILKRCTNAFDKSRKASDIDVNVAFKDDFQTVFNMPSDQLDNLMLDNEKPDLLIDTIATQGKFSLKPQPLSPERRRSSRRRWSQSEKTPIFDKIAEKSINKSVRFEEVQEEATKTKKKSVKINSPSTTPRGKQNPMVIKKTPKPKFSADNSIISGNWMSPVSCMSPPASSSTPRPQNKSLLKKVLTNEKSKAEKLLKNTSSRVKMPDFAKIHERRNGKLESIQDLVERKAQRAQYLLSGGKSLTVAKEKVEKESKKKLFGDDEDKEKNVLASKLPVPKVTKMKQKIINKKRASLEKKRKATKSPAQKTTQIPKIPAPQIKKTVPMEKNKAVASGGKVISRFGFKMQTDKVNLTKDEQIKAVCTKSKFIPNSSRTDQNRKNTAEVRTNRRFELLMKMRANEN